MGRLQQLYAMEKTVTTVGVIVTYLLPLTWMAVCYFRMVCAIRNKVKIMLK